MNTNIRQLFYDLANANKVVENIRVQIKEQQESCNHSWSQKNLEYGTRTCMECLVAEETID